MTAQQLTNRARAATSPVMQGIGSGKRWLWRQAGWSGAVAKGMLLFGGMMTTAGCVSVNAPDKPIVIELNINIKQEVVYRLAADAGNTIKDNPDIF
jgi:hypothetical protein